MKKTDLALLVLASSLALCRGAHAESAAPALMGVSEVVVEYAHFNDTKVADTCGLGREQVAATLAKAFAGSGVPAIPVADARPPVQGVARVQLIPQIDVRSDENFDCVSWISLSAESRVNTVVPPISTLRSVTVLYWHQHTMVATNQTAHEQTVNEVLQKMAAQFAQQYRLDQPPELPK